MRAGQLNLALAAWLLVVSAGSWAAPADQCAVAADLAAAGACRAVIMPLADTSSAEWAAPAEPGYASLCRQIARTWALDCRRYGDVLVCARPFTVDIPAHDFGTSLASGSPAYGLSSCRVVSGWSEAGDAVTLLTEPGLLDLRDATAPEAGATSPGLAPPPVLRVPVSGLPADEQSLLTDLLARCWLTAPSETAGWTYAYRVWPWYARNYLDERLAVMLTGPGRVPVSRRRLSLEVGISTVSDLLSAAGAAMAEDGEAMALACADEIADVPVVVFAERARADEILAGLALALHGEWRRMGDLGYLAARHSRYALEAPDVAPLLAALSPPPDPEHDSLLRSQYPRIRASDAQSTAVVVFPWSEHSAALLTTPLSPAWPLFELRLAGHGDAWGRALFYAWQPSRGVLVALSDARRRALHCTADSILGFAEGRGAPLDKAGNEALVAATENKGDLDGNELIALAKSVGVELVGVKGTLDEIGEKQGVAIVHLDWGHYVAVTDCDSAFVTLLGADGRRARFPKDALESGMSGIMFVSPELLEGDQADAGEQ